MTRAIAAVLLALCLVGAGTQGARAQADDQSADESGTNVGSEETIVPSMPHDPTTDGPVTDGPTTDGPTTDGPVPDGTATDEDIDAIPIETDLEKLKKFCASEDNSDLPMCLELAE